MSTPAVAPSTPPGSRSNSPGRISASAASKFSSPFRGTIVRAETELPFDSLPLALEESSRLTRLCRRYDSHRVFGPAQRARLQEIWDTALREAPANDEAFVARVHELIRASSPAQLKAMQKGPLQTLCATAESTRTFFEEFLQDRVPQLLERPVKSLGGNEGPTLGVRYPFPDPTHPKTSVVKRSTLLERCSDKMMSLALRGFGIHPDESLGFTVPSASYLDVSSSSFENRSGIISPTSPGNTQALQNTFSEIARFADPSLPLPRTTAEDHIAFYQRIEGAPLDQYFANPATFQSLPPEVQRKFFERLGRLTALHATLGHRDCCSQPDLGTRSADGTFEMSPANLGNVLVSIQSGFYSIDNALSARLLEENPEALQENDLYDEYIRSIFATPDSLEIFLTKVLASMERGLQDGLEKLQEEGTLSPEKVRESIRAFHLLTEKAELRTDFKKGFRNTIRWLQQTIAPTLWEVSDDARALGRFLELRYPSFKRGIERRFQTLQQVTIP